MVTIEDILGRKNKQSMDRQQMQQVQAQRNAVLGQEPDDPNWGIKPNNLMTYDEVEQEKNGPVGEVVQLADQKPKQVSSAEPTSSKPDEVPDFSNGPVVPKATMPGAQVSETPNLDGVNTMPKSLKEWAVWNEEMKRRAGVKSEEDLEKARKRDSVLAAIGDGISSLAQLYYANQGAIVNQNTGNSLSEGVAKRHEQLRRENDLRENQLLNWMRERRNAEIAKQQQKANDEYRKEVLEQRREQNRINADFKKAEQERKAEELKLKQDKEERQKVYYEARTKQIQASTDDKEIENATYYKTLADLLQGDKDIPIETAKEMARAAQQAENKKKEAEKASRKGKGSSRSGRGRSRSRTTHRGNGYSSGSGSPGTGYD